MFNTELLEKFEIFITVLDEAAFASTSIRSNIIVGSRRVECATSLAVVGNTALEVYAYLIIVEFTLANICHFMVKLCVAHILNITPLLLEKVYLGF
jgi:hypothetical protein